MDCLLKSGLTCGLAGSLISPVSRGEPAHYISTLYQLGQDSQVTVSIRTLMAATQAMPDRVMQTPCHTEAVKAAKASHGPIEL